MIFLTNVSAQIAETTSEPRLSILPADTLYKIADDLDFENWHFALSLDGVPDAPTPTSLRIIYYTRDKIAATSDYQPSLLQSLVKLNDDNTIQLQPFHILQPQSAAIDRMQIQLQIADGTTLIKTVPLITYRQKNQYRLPLEGTWFVSSGYDFGVEHRRHLTRGHFAWDFVRINEHGRVSSGVKLTEHFAYGQPVVAPADGIIIAASDSAADNTPGTFDQGFKSNYIEIDHGGEISRLVHLKQYSICVSIGDRVESGQVIAAVGNSGYSDTPHLHIGFQRRIVDRDGNVRDLPIPVVFYHYRVSWNRGIDQPVDAGRPRRGQFVRHNQKAGDSRDAN